MVLLAEWAVLLSGAPWSVKLGLGLFIANYAVISITVWMRVPVSRLIWHAEGHWRTFDRQDKEQAVELLGWSRLGILLVLQLASENKSTFYIVLLPDNVDTNLRRRLWVRLAQLTYSTRLTV